MCATKVAHYEIVERLWVCCMAPVRQKIIVLINFEPIFPEPKLSCSVDQYLWLELFTSISRNLEIKS